MSVEPTASGFSTRSLITNAGSLISTAALTSGLGAVYWWFAANHFSPRDVGAASASVSALSLASTIGTMGLATLLLGEIPRRLYQTRSLIIRSLAAGAIAGLTVGTVVAAAAVIVLTGGSPIAHSPFAVAVFAVATSLTTVGLIGDAALVGLLRGSVQLWRNGVFGVSKLAYLIVAVSTTSASGPGVIYGTWILGTVTSLVALGARLNRRLTASPTRARADPVPKVITLGSDALGHHIFNLALVTPFLALPIVVVSVLSATANGTFYIALSIASLVFVVPSSFASILFAAGSASPADLGRRMRVTLPLSALVVASANLAALPFAPLILRTFGDTYTADAPATLRFLLLAGLPLCIKTHFVSIRRVQRRTWQSAPSVWAGTVLELALAYFGGALGGLEGVALGWLCATVVEAVAMCRTVARVLRQDTEEDRAPG